MNPEERIISWLKGNKKGPFSLEIRPTGRCNLACLSCVKHASFYEKESKKIKGEISKQKYLELINDASKLSVRKILISGGGEPFLRKDILDIIKEIKKNNMEGEIITNGTLIHKNLAEKLVKLSWDKLIISLDAPNKKANDYLRTKSFDSVIKNIKNINNFKKKYKSSQPEITIAAVLSKKNYNLLFKMLKLSNELGAKFRLQELIIWSKKGDLLRLSKEKRKEFDSQIPKLIEYAKELKIETNLKDFLESETGTEQGKKEEKEFLCFAPFYDLSISEEGNARFCQMSPPTSENIRDKSLGEIWFGMKMEDFRQKMLKKEYPDFCTNCCSPRIFDMKNINESVQKKLNK